MMEHHPQGKDPDRPASGRDNPQQKGDDGGGPEQRPTGLVRFQVRVTDQQTGRKRRIAEVAMSDHACLLSPDP